MNFIHIVNIFSLLNKCYPRLTFKRELISITNLFILKKNDGKMKGKEKKKSSSVFDLL